MSEQTEDLTLAVVKAVEIIEERQDKKQAEQESLANAIAEGAAVVNADLQKELDTAKDELDKAKKNASWNGGKAPVHMKEAKLGSGGITGDNEMFRYWMKTGDNIAARQSLEEDDGDIGIPVDGDTKKALQEGTGSEGGFGVPDDLVASIVGLRNERSWPRRAGVRVIQTNLAVVDIPGISTQVPDFTRTAEEAAFASDDPALAQNQVTVHKWTTSVMMTTELLEDDVIGLESWYAADVARSMASTEARYCAVGTGSSQHTGIFTGGDTDTLTFNTDNGADSDGNLLPDAFHRLFFSLNEGYREDAVWLADGLTLRDVLTIKHTQANPAWAYGAADLLQWNGNDIRLLGKPFFQNDNIPVKASGVCFIMFGSPAYYALVERRGLVVMRNPFLRAAQGQVVFHNSFRQGGTVLVEAAWSGGVGA